MLSVTQFRQHVSTTLEDEALQRQIDAAYEAIAAYLSDADPTTELLTATGDLLVLSRRATAIISIIEREITLDPSDYQLRSTGLTLLRLRSGVHPASRWQGRIDISYTPTISQADRDRVAILLVELELSTKPGVFSQRLGDWSETYPASSGGYAQERESILSSLIGERLVLL